jgi:hypothetical protein
MILYKNKMLPGYLKSRWLSEKLCNLKHLEHNIGVFCLP